VAGTLRFAKLSTCVLDSANLRVEGGDTWICQTKHLSALFGQSEGEEGVPAKNNSSVRATAVGRDAVLAGDPKMFRLLCNTNLNMIHT